MLWEGYGEEPDEKKKNGRLYQNVSVIIAKTKKKIARSN